MTASPGPITLTLATDRDTYQPGATVEFKVTLRNSSNASVDLYFSSGRSFDITVTTPAGDEIWRWAAGRFFTQSIRQLSLAPGEDKTYIATWDQRTSDDTPAPPGRYHATATIPTDQEPRSPPATFTINE